MFRVQRGEEPLPGQFEIALAIGQDNARNGRLLNRFPVSLGIGQRRRAKRRIVAPPRLVGNLAVGQRHVERVLQMAKALPAKREFAEAFAELPMQ